MAPSESEEAEAVLSAARAAKRELLDAAEIAHRKVKDACEEALRDLDRAPSSPDRRNLNGSYRWDQSKERLEKRIGKLEVGQAKREEQIIGLIGDVDDMRTLVAQLRVDFDTTTKELGNRMTTLRELILEVKDACTLRVDALRDDTQKDKIKNQQYVIGIVVGFIVTVVAAILLAYTHIRGG